MSTGEHRELIYSFHLYFTKLKYGFIKCFSLCHWRTCLWAWIIFFILNIPALSILLKLFSVNANTVQKLRSKARIFLHCFTYVISYTSNTLMLYSFLCLPLQHTGFKCHLFSFCSHGWKVSLIRNFFPPSMAVKSKEWLALDKTLCNIHTGIYVLIRHSILKKYNHQILYIFACTI